MGKDRDAREANILISGDHRDRMLRTWITGILAHPLIASARSALAVEAQAFMAAFVDGHNHTHRHTGIGLNTPTDVHYGLAVSKAISRIERGRTQDRNVSERHPTLLNEQSKASA